MEVYIDCEVCQGGRFSMSECTHCSGEGYVMVEMSTEDFLKRIAQSIEEERKQSNANDVVE